MKPSWMPWTQYLRAGAGRRLSMLGEQLNLHWLVYNPLLFRHFHEVAAASAPTVIKLIRNTFPDARRLVDVGAGSGAYAAEAKRQGCTVVACEYSNTGRRWAAKQGVDCRPFDLNRDPPTDLEGPYDLAYCLEVAEHLPPSLGDKLVSFIAGLAPRAVFAAAHPGQGGTGHINEQPKEYWIERFERLGMKPQPAESEALASGIANSGIVARWLADNVVVLARSIDSH